MLYKIKSQSKLLISFQIGLIQAQLKGNMVKRHGRCDLPLGA